MQTFLIVVVIAISFLVPEAMERIDAANERVKMRTAIVLAVIGLAGCAATPDAPRVTAGDYCSRQGSEMGIWQCRQFYARAAGIQPPQPQPAQPRSDTGVNTGLLLAAILSGYHPVQPYNLTPYAMPIQRSITCMPMGYAVTCN